MKPNKIILTTKEQEALKRLNSLLKWMTKNTPDLNFFGFAGTFCLIKYGEDGHMCGVESWLEPTCDGGDPPTDLFDQNPEIEYELDGI
jgi:hypothetical protein